MKVISDQYSLFRLLNGFTITLKNADDDAVFAAGWAVPKITNVGITHNVDVTHLVDEEGDIYGFIQNGEFIEMVWNFFPKAAAAGGAPLDDLAREMMSLPPMGTYADIDVGTGSQKLKLGHFGDDGDAGNTDGLVYDGTTGSAWWYMSGRLDGPSDNRVVGELTMRRFPKLTGHVMVVDN